MKRNLIFLGLVFSWAVVNAEMTSIDGWHAVGSDPSAFVTNAPPSAPQGGPMAPLGGGDVLPEMKITEAICAQAVALNNDPVEIFEFVRNRIGYELYYGCLKGAEGTLLSGFGNDLDQCTLLGALLKAADNTIGVSYIKGDVVYADDFLTDLIGCSEQYLPNLNPWFLMSAPVERVDGWEYKSHYWLQAVVDGTTYQLDPSFVQHEESPVSAEAFLAEVTGYTRTNLLDAAATGAAVFTDEKVRDVNETAVKNLLRGYVGQIHQAQEEGDADVEQLVGQRRVQKQDLSSLSTNLPPDMVRVASSSVLSSLPDTRFARYELTYPSAFTNVLVKGYDLAGKRLTLFYDQANGNRPVLRMDGEELARGTSNLTLGQTYNLLIKVILPADLPPDRDTYQNTISCTSTVGYSYNVVCDLLTASPKILAQQSRKLAAYRAQGLDDSSEEVLGTTLNLMGLFYCRQNTLQLKQLGKLTGIPASLLYQSGVVAQGAGYYIDLPLCGISCVMEMPDASALFRGGSFFASGLEHGMLEQIMGPEHPGISSTKGIALGNSNGRPTYYATSANWTSGLNVRGKLRDYTSAQKDELDEHISGGHKLLLPRYPVSVGEWEGITYFVICPQYLGAIIYGDYGTQNGGYSGYQGYVPPPVVNTVTRTTYIPPPPPPVQSFRPKSIEPVDLFSGDYLLDHEDLTLSGPLPLALTRHYNSGQVAAEGVMGPGWCHSLQIEIDEHSSGDFAFGERDAADASAVLASQMVSLDLMRNEDNAKGWTTAAIAAKWAMDSAVENVVTVRIGESGRQFTRLPDGEFNPPPGSTDKLKQTNGVYILRERNADKYTFNTNNLIAEIADTDGNTLTFTYNAQTNLQSVVSSFGPAFSFSYSGGLLAGVTDNSTPTRTVQYQYDSNDNLTNFVDAVGFDWGIAYSDTNHPSAITSLTDPEGIVTIQNLYNSLGTVTQQVSATSNRWNFHTSDAQSIEEDPYGNQTTYRFDADGRTWAVQKADGTRATTAYDNRGQTTSTVTAAGVTNIFVYDNDHNLLQKTEAIGTDEEQTTSYGYDSLHRLTAVTNALGEVTRTAYDAEHHVVATTNALGDSTTFEYFPNGLLKKKTEDGGRTTDFTYDGSGNPDTVTSTDAGTVDLDYNARGELVQKTGGRGQTTDFTFDANGKPLSTLYTDGSCVSNSYWDNGLLKETTDGRGETVSKVWNNAYKLQTVTYPDGGTVSNRYDAADRLIATSDQLNSLTTYQLDSVGRATSVSSVYSVVENSYDSVGNATNSVVDPSGLNLWTATQYDPLNRPVSVQSAESVEQFSYDLLGRQTNRTDALSNPWKTEFDALGRATATVRPSGAREESDYNPLGHRTQFRNAENKAMGFGFDAQGRLIAITNAIGKVTSYSHDNNGNIISRRDAKGAETLYNYDGMNRLTNVVHEGVWKASFDHDANGNLVSQASLPATVSFSYDGMNRLASSLISVNSRSFAVTNSYDLSGNRTNIVYPGGLVVGYSYDEENRLKEVIANHANLTNQFNFNYDGASRLTGMSYPNGVNSTFSHDAESRISEYAYSSGSSNFLRHVIQRDPRGFKTIEDTYAGLLPNFTNEVHHARTHNAADQLLTAGDEAYSHDSNGCLTNSAGVSYEYDYNNRLINADGREYLYDASGARIGRVSGGVTNYFVVDYADGLKRPLAEADSLGNITRYYIWAGVQLLAHIEADGTMRYYHSDELGSTLALTDETGAVTDQFAYMPHGHTTRTGTTQTPFQWLGGYGVYYDADSDLHLTLHRAYSSDVRRFISPDPLGIDGGVNLYAYGNLNPLYFVDPLGLAVLLEAHPVVTFYVPTGHPMSFNPQPPTQVSINHSKITIIPENQDTYRNDPRFVDNVLPDERVYTTLGAGPANGVPSFGAVLKSNPGRETDVNRDRNVFSTPVTLPQGMSEDQYIQQLFNADRSYSDQEKYYLFPKNDPGYNSNSYASGLLNATGGTVSQFPPNAPGYNKPLPSQNFGPRISK